MPEAHAAPATPACPSLSKAEPGPEGFRRLALVVGIGRYANPSIPRLDGPPNDARHFYDLLTGPAGYRFPKENVCLLLDAEATTERFKEAFEQALVQRAQPGDVAVVFFAGHGSQTPDLNGDEPGESDQTLLFADARSGGVRDLVDDEFNAMLVRLSKKTSNVVVFLDSCSSASATRGDASTFAARFVPPARQLTRLAPAAAAESHGDGGKGWTPVDLPGLIVFAAASDGTAALETKGAGIFTESLVQVLSATPSSPLLYAQAERQIPPLMAAHSYQVPFFGGNLHRAVFDNKTRTRPVGWDVVSLDPILELGGPPLPGVGKGSEFRVYPGNVVAGDARDPAKAKATVVIDRMDGDRKSGLNAQAHVSARKPEAPPLAVGDLAVLARPADDYLKLKVRFRPRNEPGGLPDGEAAAMRSAIAQDPEAAMLVEPTTSAGDFELSLADAETLALRGGENRIRKSWPRPADPAEVARNLWRHARQRALLQLQAEGGDDFRDNQTLQVRLRPDADQDPCARGAWVQAEANQEQVIPLCHKWKIEVTLDRDAPYPLLIGGLVLSTDGETHAFPRDDRKVKLEPGQTTTFKEGFQGNLPLDTKDYVLVFGTREKNPVPWYRLTETTVQRSARPAPTSSLYRALDLFLRPGTRGQQPTTTAEDTTWTLSALPIRVEANPRLLQAEGASEPPKTREYTINFDIRPYLPDARETALHRVLMQADQLAKRSVADGVPYKQHPWARETDTENLMDGIDCSRAIWFAFTRSGLSYTPRDRYLSTAEMLGGQGPMSAQFEACDSDPRLGDVLVYRDEAKGVGHVVMVIDHDKRVAWGSHGYDGNVREGRPGDTGVEYQLIKYKRDWQRWDRVGMERRACWRYRAFAAESRRPDGQPGVKALLDACRPQKQCGRMP